MQSELKYGAEWVTLPNIVSLLQDEIGKHKLLNINQRAYLQDTLSPGSGGLRWERLHPVDRIGNMLF